MQMWHQFFCFISQNLAKSFTKKQKDKHISFSLLFFLFWGNFTPIKNSWFSISICQRTETIRLWISLCHWCSHESKMEIRFAPQFQTSSNGTINFDIGWNYSSLVNHVNYQQILADNALSIMSSIFMSSAIGKIQEILPDHLSEDHLF